MILKTALLFLLLYVPCTSSSKSTVCRCHQSSSVAETFRCASQTAAYKGTDEVSNSPNSKSFERLERAITQLDPKVNATKEHIKTVEQDVKQLEQQLNEAKYQHKILEEVVLQLDQEMDEANNQNSKLEQNIEEVDQELKETKFKNSKLEQRLSMIEDAFNTINNSDFWLKANRKDCNDVVQQGFTSKGVYDITVDGKMVSVYCDMTTDDGGWTTIQRRKDGSQDFFLRWQDYVKGFGDLNGEFWLGLEYLHSILTSGSYQLRVDLEDWDSDQAYALYSHFSVGDSTSNYRLEISGYSGTADFWLKANRKDCNDVVQQGFTSKGVYDITVDGKMVSVYCDMTTDDGGWTTIQRRKDGSQDFFLRWQDYVKGFGDLNGEFWLGLEYLHSILTSGSYQLRVDLEDWDSDQAYALYSHFSVGDSTSNYRLEISGYSGTAGDAMSYNNNQPFSTRDSDNDGSVHDCASIRQGGWWYKNCQYSSLNGLYLRGANIKGISWFTWKHSWSSIRRAEMKILKN